MRRIVGVQMLGLLAGFACFSQVAEERRTTVAPLPGEEIRNPCEYVLVVPAGSQPVRAVWVIYDRGPDFLKWFRAPEMRRFAREFQLALLLALHCRSKEREDMIVVPERGVGRSLFTALDQFSVSERRPELGIAPLIHMGWSGAGALVGRMAGYRPSRYLAGIAYAPGQYDPLGMDTITLGDDAQRAPQLIIANGADNVNGTERPYAYFRKHFEAGAPWTFAVQNRTPHCCLQNATTLILEWLRGVLTNKRSAWGLGRFGYITVEASTVVDEWKQPVFNATATRSAHDRNRLRNAEIPAGWLPSSRFAQEWTAFVRRPSPPSVWKP